MVLQPLGNNVLFKIIESKEEVRNGFFIPDSAAEKNKMGEVVAIGPGKLFNDGSRMAPEVKVGQKFYYNVLGFTIDTNLSVIDADDILVVVNE